MRYRSLSLAALAAGTLAAPALATDCGLDDITPTAIVCSGGYAKNILDNNSDDVAAQIAGLAAIGFTWDGSNFGSLPKLSPLPGGPDPVSIDFGQVLSGITYVGIHVGGKGGGQTTFYKFDAGSSLEAFTLNLPASSGAVLYATEAATSPAPEPASWAMMLGGFGVVGSAVRRRRVTTSCA